MNKIFTKIIFIFKYFEFIRDKRILIGLSCIFIILNVFNKFWLKPKLDEVDSQKGAIVARKMEEMDNLSPEEIIDILTIFASVNSDYLWINSINIEQNTISVTIRALDPKNIEKYIYEVADMAHLKLDSMVTKNVNYKDVVDEKEEGKKEQVPFAVKLYLDSLKKSGAHDSENSNEDGDTNYLQKNKIFFTYEAQIKLLAKSH